MKDVTAILTVYKRPEYLSKQIDAMLSQTFKISNYIICLNGSENRKKVDKVIHHK
jgi:glycosyltransferase involved in cell wall biosynthesis